MLTYCSHPFGGFNILLEGILLENIRIAIDGPAGAGKSTIARELSRRLGIMYIDTGAMYRAITYKAIESQVDINKHGDIINLAKNVRIDFRDGNLYLNDRLLDKELRCQEVNSKVSYIARIPGVRRVLVDQQRRIASSNSVIMDGRDIGSHVLPQADKKFFLIASVEERAKRRYLEEIKKGQNVDLKDIKLSIAKRDKIDSERKFAPLIKAQDAIEIDTTELSINELVNKILQLINIGGGS